MNPELPRLLLLCLFYLFCLFGAAYLTERGHLPRRLVRHPLLHALSLGAFTSAWTFFGTFDMAARSGFTYLGSHIGGALAFMLAPILLVPILRITRTYQLSSLADLFAFRFRQRPGGHPDYPGHALCQPAADLDPDPGGLGFALPAQRPA